MTNEEAIEVLEQDLPCENDEDLIEAMAMAIEALEQQPCEDCISRGAVKAYAYHRTMYPNFEDYVDKLPPVTPKGKSEYEHDHEVVKAYNDGQAYILDKIRAEIEQESQAETLKLHWSVAMGLDKAIDIIDKHISELRGDTDG